MTTNTRPSGPESGRQDKVERPHAHFADPMAVVGDSALTPSEKARALEALEQDARQLANASSEGMPATGEPNRLRKARLARQAVKTQAKRRSRSG